MNEISSFYDQTDLRYPEIAVCLEDTKGPTGKFSIPILTPFMDTDSPKELVIDNSSTKTLLSGSRKDFEIGNCTITNYLELELPDLVKHEINYHNLNAVHKGDKFIAVFVGGDINKCKLISRY